MKRAILANIVIAILTVVLYSPGLLALRPTDPNALRAALSICFAPALLLSFISVNKVWFVKEKQAETLFDAMEYLTNHKRDKYARITAEQYYQMKDVIVDLEQLTRSRFEEGSLSYNKFHAVQNGIEEAVSENIMRITKRMQLFNNNNDVILRAENRKAIEELNSSNKLLLRQANALALELADRRTDVDTKILENIKEVTNDLKYYS